MKNLVSLAGLLKRLSSAQYFRPAVLFRRAHPARAAARHDDRQLDDGREAALRASAPQRTPTSIHPRGHGARMKAVTLSLLRYPEDRLPLALVLAVFALQMAAYLSVETPAEAAVCALALLLPQIIVSMVVHNHAHVALFRTRPLNAALELMMFLETGMFASKFRLHHNRGHHLHYMDPTRDPSTWVRKDGRRMGRLVYIAHYFGTYDLHVVRIGRAYPRLLRGCLVHTALGYGALAVLIAARPSAGLLLFAVPVLLVWLNFIHFTYDDHVDLFSTNPLEASHSKTRHLLNALIFNNGYHLAHHLKPGHHWSRLPAMHEGLRAKLPPPAESTVINRLFA